MPKQTISTLILMACLTLAYAQTDSLLSKRVPILDTARSATTLQQLANEFERIALADEGSWLAHYYTAYAYVELAYQTKGDQIDTYCDQAEIYLKNAEKLQPAHTEIYALYAYLYGARVNVNPMLRGAKMGTQSEQYINLAIKANPDNPRPYLIRGMGKYYTPKIFGGGKEKAIPFLEEALEKFSSFKPQPPYAPNWGKPLTERLLQDSRKE
ncbi:MAG: hypothetical protein EAS52_09995 [Parapedobacter sp.]|nr:MAG: hypothetical protein EAS52_09995 [Parapedobacter sp.]